MSNNYQKLLEILKRWPINKEKGDRDYGLHLRNLAKAAFPVGEIFTGTETEKQQKLESLLRLADNKYGKIYSKFQTVGATGLTLSQLQESMSESFVSKYFKTKSDST